MIENNKKELFEKIVSEYDTIHIFMHDHPAPDPDSLGSAVALDKLLKDVFHKKVVVHGIPTDHRMNTKMISDLEIVLSDPRNAKEMSCVSDPRHGIMLVDCTLNSGSFQFREHLGDKQPLWVFDHHPGKESTTSETVDLQAVGACATIVTEYLQTFDVKFDPENKRDKFVATALMLGLMIDTDDLMSEAVDANRDLNTFIYLKERYDQDLYSRIKKYDYPKYFREALQNSFKEENQRVVEPFAVLTPGYMKEERLGALSFIADFWIRVERLTMVIVFTISGKEIIASVRTKEGTRASDLIKQLLPSGTGGGKKEAARGLVTVNGFFDLELLDEAGKQKFLDIVMSTLVSRLKRVIDIDE
jgi:nanoRNase/pAp phosphatase (c-di-AMP/oligoRNAs hydrolase)